MTYPQQYPPQQPQQYAPPAAPPQYPAQPQYAPAQPQYAPPMPQYPPQQGYAQPQYAPQMPPAAPAQQLPSGTLDTFYEQPSTAGGPSISWQGKPSGTQYVGMVARPITNSDVQAQTNKSSGQVQTFKDGRPKFVMIIPLNVAPSTEFPDGRAAWWVKGNARDELARAMDVAGATTGPPESGATIRITKTGERPIQGMSPATQLHVEYFRPQGAAPVQQAVPVTAQPSPVQPVTHFAAANPGTGAFGDGPYIAPGAPLAPAPAPMQEYAFAQQAQPPMQQGVQVAPMQQFAPQGVQVQPVQAPIAAPVVQAAPVSAPGAPQGMDPSQAAIWAQLTGGQAPAPQPQPQG